MLGIYLKQDNKKISEDRNVAWAMGTGG